ncbi:helix-turn-helix domain-containing protein [Streptomyces virginiae]|uniref:helix-turn-helix domain-containing protein n=1 Tax=Streptomyces virginiae TaxID=1961 RepID=UPI00382AC825
MTDVARGRGRTGDVELGAVPEVAALGNTLTDLFNGLGVTQAAYAARIHVDKSAVSRYLAGRRVPPQAFVDQLFTEIARHRGVSVQEHVKEAVRQQRLDALRVTNPDAYELDSLRAELDRSNRETYRTGLLIESLTDALEKKQREADGLAGDLAQLQIDWAAERKEASGRHVRLREEQESAATTRNRLLRQIGELRSQLAEALAQRDRAEEQGEELRAQVLNLEEELAQQQGDAAPDLPSLEEFQELVGKLRRAGDHAAAVRELVTAAHARPLADVLVLLDRLPADAAVQLVADVARMRPIPDVLAVGAHPGVAVSAKNQTALVEALAARLSPQAMARASGAWATIPDNRSALADRTLAAAVLRTESLEEARAALAPLAQTHQGVLTPRLTGRALAEKYGKGAFLETFLMVLELRWTDLVFRVSDNDDVPFGAHAPPRFLPGLLDLEPEVQTAVVRAMAAHVSMQAAGQFAQELYGRPGDRWRWAGRELLKAFLEAGEATGEGFSARLHNWIPVGDLRDDIARWRAAAPADRP